MSKLICDICGTSYSDDVDKCPTCGYSRAFEELAPDAAAPVVREKVRGGRFSKKNVRKRLELLKKTGQKSQEPVAAVEMGEELSAAYESEWNSRQQDSPVSREQPETDPVEAVPAVQEPAAEPDVALIPAAEPVREEAVEESASDPEPVVALIPAEEPVREDEAVEESNPAPEPDVILLPAEEPVQAEEEDIQAPVVLLLPEEEPAPEEAAGEASDQEQTPETEGEAEESIPVVIPTEIPEESQPEEEEKKKKGGCLLNVVLYTSLAVFLASAIYLIVMYGVPYLQNVDWPTRPAVETTMPTEEPTPAPTAEPTQAPTDAPTEAPTDPPTEPPTEAPTQAPTDPPPEPPTEAPTEPLLDVKLELNYYDLTFPTKGDVTQLKANIIPNEDITWISDDPGIVTISQTGLITAVGGGRTTVRAIYGDQEVTVKINCRF